MRRAALAITMFVVAGCDFAPANEARPSADSNLAAAAPVPASAALPPSNGSAANYRCPAPLTWGVSRRRDRDPPFDPIKNRASLDPAGAIHWNGVPIDLLTLRQYLDITASMTPPPEFILEVDPTSPCDQISRIVAMVGSVIECSRFCTYEEERFDRARMRALAAPARTAEEAVESAADNALDGGSQRQRPPPEDTRFDMNATDMGMDMGHSEKPEAGRRR